MFDNFVANTLTDIQGAIDVNGTVQGTIDKPLIYGNVDFRNTSFLLEQTQVRYSINDKIRIYHNDLFFEDFTLVDINGNPATFNGNLTTANLNNLLLNLEVSAENLCFLNTSRRDNDKFYGEVYGTATASIKGAPEGLKITAVARTERNTDFKLTLFNPSEINANDFITFINTESPDENEALEVLGRRSGVILDMDLEITPSADVELIFDPAVGDIIQANGAGKLRLEIDEDGVFSMFGLVGIDDGQYTFNLQNIVTKRFQVKPGGTISWNGPPADAIIDIDAYYETQSSTKNIIPSGFDQVHKTIPVQCNLTLLGELRSPTIQPSIVLPRAEAEMQAFLGNNIATNEGLMRQFVSLLIMGSFAPSQNAIIGITTGDGTSAGLTASEMISNQISNWLSQISNDFDLDFVYRPGDNITTQEMKAVLQTQLFDDRMHIRADVDAGGNEPGAPSGATNVVGNFDLEYELTPRISVTAYNHANDDYYLRSSEYIQGVGISYKNEFNNLRELFGRKNKRQKKKDTEEEKPALNEEAVLKEED